MIILRAEFPKIVYHRDGGTLVLHTLDAQMALGAGWYEDPSFREPVVRQGEPVLVDDLTPSRDAEVSADTPDPAVEPEADPVADLVASIDAVGRKRRK